MPARPQPLLKPLILAPAQAQPPAGLSCALACDLAQAEKLVPEWSALLRGSARGELTQSPEWLLAWWRVFGTRGGRQLRVVLFHDEGRPVGLAPLVRRLHWYGGSLPFRRLEFLGSGEPEDEGIYSNHLNVVAESGAEERVARRLVAALCQGQFGPWDEVVLPMMAADSPMPALVAAAFREARVAAEVTETARAPYVRLPKTWEAYLAGFAANGRRNIVRSLRDFDEWAAGTAHLESVRTAADLDRGKEILVRLHRERWSEGCGVFRAPLYVQFHDLVMRQLLDRGELELHWLCAHGRPVAAFYGMRWAGKVYAYQTGRRTDLPGPLRPGAVLLARLVRRAIESGCHEFDLLADDAPFKRQFTPHARPIVRVRAARRCLVESARLAARYSLCRLRALRRSTAREKMGRAASGKEAAAPPTAGQRPGQP